MTSAFILFCNDPCREIDDEREINSIEISDAEYARRFEIARPKPPEEVVVITESIDNFTKNLTIRKKNAKSESEAPKKRAKKANSKPNLSAVESVQAEL